ncbi:hypothetical protein Slin14017_G054830 [Septoria linicola]|nr:hypothetical protein Slin14017_G054830 [Septoria linicola]
MPLMFQISKPSACYRFHQVNYDSCTAEELRRFLKAQTQLEVPKKYFFFSLGKQDLINRLLAFDENATFRFGDLPTELRLHVYEHLAFHPQILATCKHYLNEAEQTIDDAANKIKITGIDPPRGSASATVPPTGLAVLFGATPDDEGWGQNAIPQLTLNTNVLKLPSTDGSLLQLSKQLESIHSHAFSASQVLLDCSITRISAAAVNRALYLLATILNSAHRVEVRVDITLESSISSEEDYEVVVQALYPLTKVGSGVFLTIGNCPPALRGKLEMMLAESGPNTTTLFDAMQLEMEIRDEMDILQKAGMLAMSHYNVLHWLRAIKLKPMDRY